MVSVPRNTTNVSILLKQCILVHTTVPVFFFKCGFLLMRQVRWKWKRLRVAVGNTPPSSDCGGPEGGEWRCGGRERPDSGPVQPEDDCGVCGFQPRWHQQRHFCHGGFWWVCDVLFVCLNKPEHSWRFLSDWTDKRFTTALSVAAGILAILLVLLVFLFYKYKQVKFSLNGET